MKAKTRKETKIKDKIPFRRLLGGRHCVEPRVSLFFSFLFFLSFPFFLEWMNGGFAFFSISTVSSFLVLGSLTSSSGKYIHISGALDRIFISISISISHAATVLLLPTSY